MPELPGSLPLAFIEVDLTSAESRRLANLCGPLDQHLRQIETRLGIEIHHRGQRFRLAGPASIIATGQDVLQLLYQDTEKTLLNPELVHLRLCELSNLKMDAIAKDIVIKTRRSVVRPRGINQQDYVQRIPQHTLNFGIGPAGTGKTYLAVACAVVALEQAAVQRLVLVRPAVEAGERLGFLPGDLSQKIDPYLRPLYDALYELLGFEKVNTLITRNVIELAPLGFMRGRTLNDAFIILDEAQNTTPEQMKMFLTRMGFGSTVVVTGDITQIDLPRGQPSGLRQAIEILAHLPDTSFTFFNTQDVVRHALVQRVVNAYAQFEQNQSSCA